MILIALLLQLLTQSNVYSVKLLQLVSQPYNKALYPEAALLLKDHKLLITTDSVQYHEDWSYFSWFTKFAFKMLGFKIGINIGPPWLKRVTPKGESLKEDFEKLLGMEFSSLIAAHGKLLKSGAKEMLKSEIKETFGATS